MPSTRFILAALCLGFALSPAFPACAQQEDAAKTAILQKRAVAALREVMTAQEQWLKVHAAEALLWNGYPEFVRTAFLADEKTAGPKYRIGVWRVLAQEAAPRNPRLKEDCVARIRAAFADVNGPDRLHACETLAKLGETFHSDELIRVAREGEGSFRAYARWIIANNGHQSTEADLASLLDSSDPKVRGTVGYALRFFPSLRPATFTLLKQTANAEADDSPAAVHLVSACYVHAPPKEKPAFKERLVRLAEAGGVGAKFELGMALGRCGTAEDLAYLSAFLDSDEADVRVAAAHAILKIAARGSQEQE